MDERTLDCFFVTPFGDKEHQMAPGAMAHYELLRPAIKEIIEEYRGPGPRIRFRRADEIVEMSVQESFIGALQKADIVIAELSANNANVFYELGIRFALRRSITIPIWQKGTRLPTDIEGILGVEYDPTNPKNQKAQFHEFLSQRLQKLNPIDSPVYRVLPHLLDERQIKNLKARVEELEKALAETRLDAAVQLTWDEAEKLLSKGDTAAALDILKIACKSAPANIRLAVRYGQLLSQAERHDESIAALEAAVALVDKGPGFIPYRELGMAFKRAKKTQLAIDWLTKAVSENPRDSDTHGIIGGVYKDRGDLDKAIDSYQRGFDVDQKSTYCLLNILCLLQARAHSGDKPWFDRLLPVADRLTANPTTSNGADHWAMFDRAHYLAFAEKGQEATELFRRALERTRTIGELKSARRNLDLLVEEGTTISGLPDILSLLAAAEVSLSA